MHFPSSSPNGHLMHSDSLQVSLITLSAFRISSLVYIIFILPFHSYFVIDFMRGVGLTVALTPTAHLKDLSPRIADCAPLIVSILYHTFVCLSRGFWISSKIFSSILNRTTVRLPKLHLLAFYSLAPWLYIVYHKRIEKSICNIAQTFYDPFV